MELKFIYTYVHSGLSQRPGIVKSMLKSTMSMIEVET